MQVMTRSNSILSAHLPARWDVSSGMKTGVFSVDATALFP